MAKIIILEGARTGGKTTVARILRSTLKSSTLINMTGYPDDGPDGLRKIVNYYDGFFRWINCLGNGHTLILDRTFFSEAVFSKLYKSYDFTNSFYNFLEQMREGDHEVFLYLFKVRKEDVFDRLKRDKTDHFAIGDSVEEIMKQQDLYADVISTTLSVMYGNERFSYTPLNTHIPSPNELAKRIRQEIS